MNIFFSNELRSERALTAVQKLKLIAEDVGLTMARLALAWVLRDARVQSAIIGASRPEQIFDNAAASDVRLEGEVLAAIDQVLTLVS